MELWDPLRKKNVAATPEERVRQWFISALMQNASVPAHMMMSETGFNYGGKRYRTDILIFDRNAAPLAVVECKRPDVKIDGEVARQALRYNMVLSVKWIFLTNGTSTYVFRRNSDVFEPCGEFPSYETMLCNR